MNQKISYGTYELKNPSFPNNCFQWNFKVFDNNYRAMQQG